MANSFTVGRPQLLFALCLPLAILLGYLLSDPTDSANSFIALMMIGALSIPLLIRGYHAALIFTWNASITPIFLPGQPYLWIPLAFVGVGFAILNRFTSSDVRFIVVPSVSRPLLLLLGVTMFTCVLRGGFGLHSLGSAQYGGRNYFYVFAAIAGFFVFVSQRIPAEKAQLYLGLYSLSGITALVPNLAYLLGRSWFFLFYLFPPLYAYEQALGDISPDMQIVRIVGLSAAAMTLAAWLIARYGLRRIFSLRRPWPLLLFLAALSGCLSCGFRSLMLIFIATFMIQFWLEGLITVRNVLIMGAILVTLATFLIPNAGELPLVVQRSISFLPLRLSPVVEMSAQGSNEWRLEMWQQVLPQVPHYLFAGKGFGLDPTELAFAEYNARYGIGFGGSLAAGDYHNGPLSLIIPLGIWGVIAFIWFSWASLRYLLDKHKNGDPQLRIINTFLLSYFAARLIVFVFVVGNFYSDLFMFTGIIGFSISLNGGLVRKPMTAEASSISDHGELLLQSQLSSPRTQ